MRIEQVLRLLLRLLLRRLPRDGGMSPEMRKAARRARQIGRITRRM